MKLFKYLFFFLLFLFNFLNCKNNFPYYDIDSPRMQYRCCLEDKVLFQFNEPIKILYFFIKQNENNKLNFSQPFPVANFFVNLKEFSRYKQKNIYMFSEDMWGNTSINKIPTPIFNAKPISMKFDRLRLRYSKKKKQLLTIKIDNNGYTNGYNFIFYYRGHKNIIEFSNMSLNNNEYIKIYMNKYNKKNKIISNKIISLSQGYFSSTYSLIYIEDNRQNIMDYILYYNLKKHDKQYYFNKKAFCKMIKDLRFHDVENINITDINGTTTKKILVKYNNKWTISN